MDATISAKLAQFGNFITLLAPVIGISGIIGFWIKSRLDQNSDNKRKIRDEKEKQYKAFLNNLMGFFKAWEDKALQLQFIWDVCANAPVYASDEVLRLAHNYIKSFDKSNPADENKRQRIYAELVITIRNELNKITGGSESELNEAEIKVFGLNGVRKEIKKQFLDNMHPNIKS